MTMQREEGMESASAIGRGNGERVGDWNGERVGDWNGERVGDWNGERVGDWNGERVGDWNGERVGDWKREEKRPRRWQAGLAILRPGRERPVREASPTVLRTGIPFRAHFDINKGNWQRRFAVALLSSLFPLPSSLLLSGCGKRAVPGMAAVPVLPAMAAGSPAFLDCNPKWSSDGTRIAFLRATPDRKLQLFVADSELKKAVALIQPEIVNPDRPYAPAWKRYTSPDTLAWSPDDHWIAYERSELFEFGDRDRLPGTGLWMLDMTTRKSRPLATHTRHYTGDLYYYRYPQWAPDGGRVAFVGEGINGQRAIFTRNFDFNDLQVRLRYDQFADSDWPAWSPVEEDAPQLAFRQGIRRAPTTPTTDTLRVLQTGAANGSASREWWRAKPTRTREPRIGSLAWSPDGKRIACAVTPDAQDFTRSAIAILDGSGAIQPVSPQEGRGYFAPVWINAQTIGALATQSGGSFAVVALNIRTKKARTLGEIPTSDCDWSPHRTRLVYAAPPSENGDPGLKILELQIGQ